MRGVPHVFINGKIAWYGRSLERTLDIVTQLAWREKKLVNCLDYFVFYILP